MNPLRVFVGYDENEAVAFHVLSHSLMRHSTIPLSIIPLISRQLPLTRERNEFQSTDFAFTRFLVPWLCQYQGIAIFMDCDILCRTDIGQIPLDLNKAVSVVKHNYTPRYADKFLGQKNPPYEKKNWSSVMAFNNPLCTGLTPDIVNGMTGMYLHQFKWVNDEMIGELPKEYNHLVGEYDANPQAKLVHYTLGTPCFAKYARCEYAEDWYEEKNRMLAYNRFGEFAKEERNEPETLQEA